MVLWLILALMTVAALLAVVWPLTRRFAAASTGGSDVAVYRDQLEEIERDRALGLLAETEAEAARVEISRRLLSAVDGANARRGPTSGAGRRRTALVVALLVLPVVAGSLYFKLGSPELASSPAMAESAVSPGQESIDTLIAQAEEHLQRNPEDGRGWEVLAPVYMRLDRYSDSVLAWRKALALLGESAERDANLGEALTAGANGVVTAEGEEAFTRAVTLDKTIISARYYLGLAAEQDGQREKAAKIWGDLLADSPPGAFWIDEVRSALARVQAPVTGETPAPTAGSQPPEQQNAMIQGMVDGLAARLKKDGFDADGWVRLIHSYHVLGEEDKARAATIDAQQALANDADKLAKFNGALKELQSGGASAAFAAHEGSASQQGTVAAPPPHQGGSVQDMVGRLAERLKSSDSDPQGWLMLVRSYATLGEKDKAATAVKDARQALAASPDDLDQFNKALASLNLEK
jgi:cytochrome c-type biogenesis protein CcmH